MAVMLQVQLPAGPALVSASFNYQTMTGMAQYPVWTPSNQEPDSRHLNTHFCWGSFADRVSGKGYSDGKWCPKAALSAALANKAGHRSASGWRNRESQLYHFMTLQRPCR